MINRDLQLYKVYIWCVQVSQLSDNICLTYCFMLMYNLQPGIYVSKKCTVSLQLWHIFTCLMSVTGKRSHSTKSFTRGNRGINFVLPPVKFDNLSKSLLVLHEKHIFHLHCSHIALKHYWLSLIQLVRSHCLIYGHTRQLQYF